MKKSIWSVFLVFVCLSILLSGCATAKVKTSVGNMVITKAEIAINNPTGDVAAPGYQILNVWFKSADGSKTDGSTFYAASNGAYVISDDGSKTERYMGGLVDGKPMVGFTPPLTAHKFTLYWPGNDPIELTLSK
jgi:hypothetical protein